MKGQNKANTQDAPTEAYAAAIALQPVIDKAVLGLPPAARHLMEIAIPLRPAAWWNPMFIQQLKNLSEAMYLCSFYHRKEMDAAHADELNEAMKYNKLANSKIPVIRALQATLQLTPSSLHGQASRHAGASELAVEVAEIIADVNDLYAK
jgi:hypothetical protein